MLDEFHARGELTSERLGGLRGSIPDTRYLMLARIEKDTVKQDLKDSEVDGTRTQTASAERRVTVALHVYDLEACKSVWSGAVRGDVYRANKKKSAVPEEDDDGILEEILDDIVDDLLGTGPAPNVPPSHPTAASSDTALELAFRGLAENMPE